MNAQLKFLAAIAIVVSTVSVPLAPPDHAYSASPTAPAIRSADRGTVSTSQGTVLDGNKASLPPVVSGGTATLCTKDQINLSKLIQCGAAPTA